MIAGGSLSCLVFVGTYTQDFDPAGEEAEGIYVYRMSPENGSLRLVDVMKGIVNPSFLAFHPNRRYLYSVNEVDQFKGQPGGGVSAFSIDVRTGKLAFLNHQLSKGVDPCHLCVDATGRYVLAANYNGGNFSLLPVESDGSLLPAVEVVQHHGSGQDPNRQEGPHVHSVNLDPGNRFVLIADLGLDRLMAYRLDLESGKINPQSCAHVKGQAGSGPRHLEFHPDGRFVYLVNELNSTLGVYLFNPSDGSLREIQVVPMLPKGYAEINLSADVHVAPSGRFVYASNRGHDSIVIYAVDQESGRLTCIGHEPTGGKYPRNFAIDPTGTFLLVANKNSGTIVPFRLDQQTGKLSSTGQVTQVPTPVCIKFYQEA